MSDFNKKIKEWALMVENGTLDLDGLVLETETSLDDTKTIETALANIEQNAVSLKKKFSQFSGKMSYGQDQTITKVNDPDDRGNLDSIFLAGNDSNLASVAYDNEEIAREIYKQNSDRLATALQSGLDAYCLVITFRMGWKTGMPDVGNDLIPVFKEYYKEVKTEGESAGLEVLDMEVYTYGEDGKVYIPMIRSVKNPDIHESDFDDDFSMRVKSTGAQADTNRQKRLKMTNQMAKKMLDYDGPEEALGILIDILVDLCIRYDVKTETIENFLKANDNDDFGFGTLVKFAKWAYKQGGDSELITNLMFDKSFQSKKDPEVYESK